MQVCLLACEFLVNWSSCHNARCQKHVETVPVKQVCTVVGTNDWSNLLVKPIITMPGFQVGPPEEMLV